MWSTNNPDIWPTILGQVARSLQGFGSMLGKINFPNISLRSGNLPVCVGKPPFFCWMSYKRAFFSIAMLDFQSIPKKCHWNFLVILLLSKRLPDPVKARHLICFSLRSAEGCEVQQGPSEEGANHYQCLKIQLGKRVLDRIVHLWLAWVERILRPIQSRLSIVSSHQS
jgi:hypothetical protein